MADTFHTYRVVLTGKMARKYAPITTLVEPSYTEAVYLARIMFGEDFVKVIDPRDGE